MQTIADHLSALLKGEETTTIYFTDTKGKKHQVWLKKEEDRLPISNGFSLVFENNQIYYYLLSGRLVCSGMDVNRLNALPALFEFLANHPSKHVDLEEIFKTTSQKVDGTLNSLCTPQKSYTLLSKENKGGGLDGLRSPKSSKYPSIPEGYPQDFFERLERDGTYVLKYSASTITFTFKNGNLFQERWSDPVNERICFAEIECRDKFLSFLAEHYPPRKICDITIYPLDKSSAIDLNDPRNWTFKGSRINIRSYEPIARLKLYPKLRIHKGHAEDYGLTDILKILTDPNFPVWYRDTESW